MSVNLLLVGGALLLAGVLSLVGVEVVNRRPVIGPVVLFLWLGISVLFIERPELFVRNIGGINVVVTDILCAFFGGIGLLRFLRSFQALVKPVALPLVVFVATLGLSYVRGLGTFGLQHATNEFREFFYFLSSLLFALSFKPERLAERAPWFGLIGGVILIMVAAARVPLMQGFELEDRIVPSYAALAMGQAFFCGWCWVTISDRSPKWRAAIFVFLPVTLLMFHRSVWICLAFGLLTLLALDRDHRGTLSRVLVIGGVVGAILAVSILGQKVADGFNSAVTEATSSEQSTFIWRMEGWLALLRPPGGWNITDLIIGRPMGSGYARILTNSSVNAVEIESGVIPHNYYLSILLRGGIVGLAAFLWLHLVLLKVLIGRVLSSPRAPLALLFIILLITELVYYVPYSADSIQGVFLGCAVSLVSYLLVLPSDESRTVA